MSFVRQQTHHLVMLEKEEEKKDREKYSKKRQAKADDTVDKQKNVASFLKNFMSQKKIFIPRKIRSRIPENIPRLSILSLPASALFHSAAWPQLRRECRECARDTPYPGP